MSQAASVTLPGEVTAGGRRLTLRSMTFRNLGFRPEALLLDHVKDRDGKKRDLLVMSLDVAGVAAQMHAYGVDAIAE